MVAPLSPPPRPSTRTPPHLSPPPSWDPLLNVFTPPYPPPQPPTPAFLSLSPVVAGSPVHPPAVTPRSDQQHTDAQKPQKTCSSNHNSSSSSAVIDAAAAAVVAAVETPGVAALRAATAAVQSSPAAALVILRLNTTASRRVGLRALGTASNLASLLQFLVSSCAPALLHIWHPLMVPQVLRDMSLVSREDRRIGMLGGPFNRFIAP